MAKEYVGTCAYCGKAYTRDRTPRGITCSARCQGLHFRWLKKQITCEKCGNIFVFQPRSNRRKLCTACFSSTSPNKYILHTAPQFIRAYLAGIIDGEGSISACRINKASVVQFQVTVNMTDREPIDLLVYFYGGHTYEYRNPKHPNWRKQYRWQATSEHGARLLRDILPHLRIKKRQAEVYLKARATFELHRSKTFPSIQILNREDVMKRLAYMEELRRLNQRAAEEF